LQTRAHPCAIWVPVQSQCNALLRCVVRKGFSRILSGRRENPPTENKTTRGQFLHETTGQVPRYRFNNAMSKV
jgi:hypothetical protein